MDTQIRGMITLLRSALKNEALVLPKDFNLHSACLVFYEQHLTGLAVRGATRCGFSVTAPELRGLTAEMCKSIEVSRAQTRQLERVYALFEANVWSGSGLKLELHKRLIPSYDKDYYEYFGEGWDTALGEKGSGLSEGQMQRLSVARAILSGRPILLLDEATSALDAALEYCDKSISFRQNRDMKEEEKEESGELV